jgi:hypothetical protein
MRKDLMLDVYIQKSYSWCVKLDKGNPASATIDKKTGVVTAKKAETAYIGCEVTLNNGQYVDQRLKLL